MVKVATINMLHSTCVVLALLFSSRFLALAVGDDGVFGRSLDAKPLGKEKLTHFKFYWHDIISGKNPSCIEVVHPPNPKLGYFGFIRIFDNRMTIGPEYDSRLVGRGQGFYADPDQTEVSLLMYTNFLFLEGKYNGSTVTVLGRNPIDNATRELTVVGGSGIFRFARGYTQIKTYFYDLKTLDATIEYDLYVLHYE